MEKKHNSENLFYYSVAHKKQKRVITAQVFWAFSFERYIKEIYGHDFGGKGLVEIIHEIESHLEKSVIHDLHTLRIARNTIIHNDFLNEADFRTCQEKLAKLIFKDKKTLLKIECEVDTEFQIDLALLFKDKRVYNYTEVLRLSSIENDDFNNDSELEKRVWSLKYKLNEIFDKDRKKFGKLQTGLVSDFGVDSEWIWIPVGYNIGDGNERIRKAIISILLFRDKRVRIYLDFGTQTLAERDRYYNLLNKNNFKEKFRQLCDRHSEIAFWNVEHYSLITKRISIKDWLDGKTKEVEKIISDERNPENPWHHKRMCGNILLFGFEEDNFVGKIDDLAKKCKQYIKELLPFLKEIDT